MRLRFLFALASWLLPALGGAATSSFKLFVRETGVYRVEHRDLVKEGWRGGAVPASQIGLTNRGSAVPIHVEDRGDGRFGRGDWIEFVGERLAGEFSYYDEISPLNAYVLDLDAPAEARQRVEALPAIVKPSHGVREPFQARLHYEENLLLLRFRPTRDEQGGRELWYWAKLTHLDRVPFRVILDLENQRRSKPLTLRAHFRGWSTHRRSQGAAADHQVDVTFNGVPVATAAWNGQEAILVEVTVPRDSVRWQRNIIQFDVPRREIDGEGETLIDVVLLNWVEVSHSRGGNVDPEDQLIVGVRTEESPAALRLRPSDGCDLTLYGTDGTRVGAEDLVPERMEDGWGCLFMPSSSVMAGDADLLAVPPGGFALPVRIEADLPSRLRRTDGGADYLMIAHPALMSAVEPLAKLHRKRGLVVEMTDVRDVYDEFNYGIPHPKAIKSFIRHSYRHWNPRPRFVLLVGDASWDPHNQEAVDPNYSDWTYRPGETARFTKNNSDSYDERSKLNRRNLIPTWNYASYEGHAASDNWFVSVEGDDFLPDLAIGRLPVTEIEEAKEIVAKTIRYASAEVGPWRRSLLWVTNEQKHYQTWSDQLSAEAAERGFGGARVYPQPEETDNELHQVRLREEFDRGNLLVHFVGHGGRYIWRTGPPDYEKNHDLFTLEDLDHLKPGSPLSVILAMTCYSAPFDHPTADSIGEKFLRLDDAGAVAVLAASWRNSPTKQFSRSLMNELLAGGPIGEAVRRAKLRIRNQNLVETYNLLGDPAIPLALPQLDIELAASERGVHVEMDQRVSRGRALVEWLGADNEVVWSQEVVVKGDRFSVPFEGVQEIEESAQTVSVYVWDSRRGIDGIGHLELEETAEAAATPAAGGASGSGGPR